MSQSKTVVMLYEDDDVRRKRLREELQTEAREVVTPGSAYSALTAVKEEPEKFDVILIDRHFSDAPVGSLLDLPPGAPILSCGDDLAAVIKRGNPTIPIILYTYTTRGDFTPTIAEAQARGGDSRRQVKDLLDELRKRLTALNTISDRLRGIQEVRRTRGRVVAGLGIGFQLVDTYGRIWFRDDAYLRTVGDSGLPFNICYCKSHGYPLRHGRCRNCLMNRLLTASGRRAAAATPAGEADTNGVGHDGHSVFQIYYIPTYPNGPGTEAVFQYLSVLASPVWSEPGGDGTGVKDEAAASRAAGGDQGEMIGVVEAVSRMPAGMSSALDSLSLIDHLEILASALEDIGIGRVRVYRVAAMCGADGPSVAKHGLIYRGPIKSGLRFSKVVVPFKKKPELRPAESGKLAEVIDLEEYVGLTDKLRADLRILPGHDPVGVALFDIWGRFIGLVAMDNGVSETRDFTCQPPLTAVDLTPASIGRFHPPAAMSILEEMARVIASKPLVAGGGATSRDKTMAQHIFQGIRMRIAANIEADPGNMLERILAQVRRRIPAIAMAHVRRLEGHAAISTARVGEYGDIADECVDVRTSRRMTAKAARMGLPQYVDDITALGPAMPGYAELTDQQREMMLAYPSHAVYPLLAEGQVIGTVSFQSPLAAFFRDDRRYLFEMVAGLLARRLRDFIAARHQAVRADAEAARADTLELGTRVAFLVLHNINQPLGTIRTYVKMARMGLADTPAGLPDIEAALDKIDQSCARIARIRHDFLHWARTSPEKPGLVDLHELIENVCRETMGP